MTTDLPLLDTHDIFAPLDPDDRLSAVSVILKLRGETCDIDCLYCFEKRKQAPGGRRITADQVHSLARLFAGRPMAVELHGGEPLTAGKDEIAAVLDALAANPDVVRVSMQTNGLLLDDAWLDLLYAHCPGLEIGLSLDGDALGNSWRVGYDGRPTYPRVVETLQLLERRSRSVGIICAVTPHVLGRAAEVIDHLAAFGAVSAISLVPCFDASVSTPTRAPARRSPASRRQQVAALGPGGPAWAITPDQYAAFVLAAATRWIGTGLFRTVKLDPVVAIIRRLRGLESGSCHFDNLKCDHVFTLYPDDRLGSCDELPWPQARLTSLTAADSQQTLRRAHESSSLLRDGRSLIRTCTTCDYRSSCGGGCLAVRLRHTLAGDDEAYCRHRMRLIDGIAALVAQPEHPGAAWCTHLHWRPRQPNVMHGVEAFLVRWDDPAAPREPARLHTSDLGNINTMGLPGVHEADDLDPRHPQWHDGLEPGVRPLVRAFAEGWGFVTYDSCQGHPAAPTAAQRPLSVGILPRDRHEYAHVAARLCRLAEDAERVLPAGYDLELGRCLLTSGTTGVQHHALELRLVPALGSDPQTYFAGLADAAATLADLTTAPADSSGQAPHGCACPIPQDADRSLPEEAGTSR
ncbi:radical SAM/SPASM domain-containing protein [Streptacidiphilus albus]|uniref:radical SAM/SPASM domain-containing protein n=1 Tax=Streptacidiphilus albus TaxID=105425 RepID=UPI0005A6DF3B|nr:radical SAM protein [Streptacidiphilus albus]